MHVNLGGYHIRNVEFSAAFDINATKVGKDLSEAAFAEPNNTCRFADLPPSGVRVQRGKTLDGLGKYLKEVIVAAPGEPVDVARVLRQTRTDVVVSYLPVGMPADPLLRLEISTASTSIVRLDADGAQVLGVNWTGG